LWDYRMFRRSYVRQYPHARLGRITSYTEIDKNIDAWDIGPLAARGERLLL